MNSENTFQIPVKEVIEENDDEQSSTHQIDGRISLRKIKNNPS